MNIWIAETDLMKHYYLRKKDFYSSLNMENIPSVDFRHAKRVFKNFNNRNIVDYHDVLCSK